MVAEVLEVLRVAVADPRHLPFGELRSDLLERLHLELQRDQLTTDLEQALLDVLGLVALHRLVVEDLALDLGDLLLEVAGTIEAVVDERVEHAPDERPEGGDRSLREAREDRIDRPGPAFI